MSEFWSVMPFPKTQAGKFPYSNGAICRAMPVWKTVILNARAIQISENVARFRGRVRSCRSGSMPLIVGGRLTMANMLPKPIIEKSENAVYIR